MMENFLDFMSVRQIYETILISKKLDLDNNCPFTGVEPLFLQFWTENSINYIKNFFMQVDDLMV